MSETLLIPDTEYARPTKDRHIFNARPPLRGDIAACHAALGGDEGVLGPPVTPERSVADGVEAGFRHGIICWSAGADAHEIHGPILDRYQALGGAAALGIPLSGILALPGGAQLCRFRAVSIFWSGDAARQAFEVRDPIREAYEETGGPPGFLGLPTSGEITHPETGIRYNSFANGIIVLHPEAGVHVIPQLRLHLGRVSAGAINDGLADKSAEIVTYHTVKVNGSPLADRRRAPSGHAETSFDIDADYDIGPVTADTRIEVTIDVDDWDRVTSNDRLGSLNTKFDIANLWGILGGQPAGVYVDVPATSAAGDLPRPGNLRFHYSVAALLPQGNKQFREQWWWRSGNFTTADLTLEQYADTFKDVGVLGNTWDKVTHPFEWAYYELPYRGSAKRGNCFGMCLEAIYARVGASVFQEPLYGHRMNAADDPGNTEGNIFPGVRRVINDKHAYQLGAEALRWYASRFASLEALSPLRVYDRVRSLLERGDYPILSLVDTTRFTGHAVMPYRCIDGDGSSANPHRILVADPNVVWRQSAADPSSISIFGNDTFDFPGTRYRSRPAGVELLPSMLLLEIPFHRLSKPPRTPFWEIALALALLGGLIVLGGDARTAQLSAGDRHLYRTKGSRRLGVVADGIPGLARIPLFDASEPAPELYAQHGELPDSLRHQIATDTTGRYQQMFAAPKNILQVDSVIEAGGMDTLTFEEIRSARPVLHVETSEEAKTARVRYASLGEQLYFAADLHLAQEAAAQMTLSNDLRSLVIVPAGPAKPVAIEMRRGRESDEAARVRITVTPEAGAILQVRPSDWNEPKREVLVERLSGIQGSVLSRTVHRGN